MSIDFIHGSSRSSRLALLGCTVLAAATATATVPAVAETVVEHFDDAANVSGWSWSDLVDSRVNPSGGNPQGWVDSGAPYIAFVPFVSANPPAGSALRLALASGSLRTASIDVQRLDTTGVPGCQKTRLQASFISLSLQDSHTSVHLIEGRSLISDTSLFPELFFPWLTATYVIPSDALDTPPGWELVNPDAVPSYTWADLMHNVDSIAFYIGDPDQHAFGNCSHLGADNIVVTYGARDSLFSGTFEKPHAL